MTETMFNVSPLGGQVYDGAISIADYTTRHRSGLRGAQARSVLIEAGWSVPAHPNEILQTEDRGFIMALSQREFWLLEPTRDALSNSISTTAVDKYVYPLFCQSSHCWLVVTGELKYSMMAKLCGVDLSDNAFATGTVAQTQMALINCIIARHEMAGHDVFSLFVDHSLAEYALEVLLDARDEFV